MTDPIDISTLTAEQRAALLAELQAPVDSPAPAPDATAQPVAPAADAKAVTLDDLSNDPTLLASLTPEQAFTLYNEAETLGATLAGSVFQSLYAAADAAGQAGQQ